MTVKYYGEKTDKELLEKSLKARKEAIKSILKHLTDNNTTNWQMNQTPDNIIDMMLSQTLLDNKSILVICNLEFLEGLIYRHGVDSEQISFISDSELEERVAKSIYKIKDTIFLKDQKELKKEVVEKMSKNYWDLTFSNPNWNDNADLKILSSIYEITEEMVIVQPAAWLLDLKDKFPPYIYTKKLLAKTLKTALVFNGNPVFGIDKEYPCIIIYSDKGKDSEAPIDINYFERTFMVDDINDITVFGPEWFTVVKSFMTKIQKYVSEHGSVLDHKVMKINEDKFYCYLDPIIGDVAYRGNQKPELGLFYKQYKSNFYTVIQKDSDTHKKIKNPDLKASNTNTPGLVFEFATEIERDNFIFYLKSYFARFCLSLLKTKAIIVRGEMSLIPWIDFTKEWTDERLFEYFDVNKETQEYIKTFLPDHYGIKTHGQGEEKVNNS